MSVAEHVSLVCTNWALTRGWAEYRGLQLTSFQLTLALYNFLQTFLNFWLKIIVKKVTSTSLFNLMTCENNQHQQQQHDWNIMQIFIIVESHSNLLFYNIPCFSPETLNIYKVPSWGHHNFRMNINRLGWSGWYLSCQHLWQVQQLKAAWE